MQRLPDRTSRQARLGWWAALIRITSPTPAVVYRHFSGHAEEGAVNREERAATGGHGGSVVCAQSGGDSTGEEGSRYEIRRYVLSVVCVG